LRPCSPRRASAAQVAIGSEAGNTLVMRVQSARGAVAKLHRLSPC
jgi:hypothetical protein